MKRQSERAIMNGLFIFGLVAVPFTIWKHKDIKEILIVFLLNSYNNIFVAPYLASNKVLQYPHRFLPKIYKSSILYDYFLCSLVSMWYVASTQKGKPLMIFLKVWLFALPQALVERWLERHTSLIKYNKGWTWVHSLITIATAKLLIRAAISFINYLQKLKTTSQMGNSN